MRRLSSRSRFGLGAAAMLVALMTSAGPAGAATSSFSNRTCGNTDPANLFTVPAGVTSATVFARGDAGRLNGAPPGAGDIMGGTLSGLTTGQVLDICVGVGGGAAGTGGSAAAGGGASGVALGSDFSTPVLIAGGGGGGALFGIGGSAGLPNATGGTHNLGGGGDGAGGTQIAPGAGGAGATNPGEAGHAGSATTSAGLGAGGAGGDGSNLAGGGGGAGWYGGGGGGGAPLNFAVGSGGGGSDYCAPSLPGAVVLSGCAVTGHNSSTFVDAVVILTYTLPTSTLTVTPAGAGVGTVTSSPMGIDCGGVGHTTCSGEFETGSSVTLTAAPAAGSQFTGFTGGGCPAGASLTCAVTMSAAQSVTATFAKLPQCDTSLAPVGCWGFDETSGTTAADASGNANNGTYFGSPVLGAPGVFATAVTMDGVNDYVRVADSNSLDVGNAFTLEGWIRRDSTSHSDSFFNKGANAFQLVALNAAGGGQVLLRKAGVTTVAQSTAGVPADGAFHHVVATKSGSAVHIYIDGADVTQLVAATQVLASNTQPLYFSETSGDRAQGRFDAFAIYGRALTAAEVAARYAAGRP
jgi:hypothetical protein